MRRYHFGLEPVLRVRRIQRDAARTELARASTHQNEMRAALGESIERHRSLPSGDAVTPVVVLLARRARHGLSAATVAAATQEHERASAQLEDARSCVADATRRVSGLERLDERRREEHALATLHEEHALLDELVTARHHRSVT